MAETSREGEPPTAPNGAVALLECKFDRAAIAALRGEVSRCGTTNGLTDIALSNFVLAVNEITTNAVRYAGGHGQLRLWRHGNDLWCQVVDDGPGIPAHVLNESHRPKPGHIRGRGLWLARHICASVEIETDRSSGTRVLLRYALPATGP
jgi:serine/threonine-protein kinase RsbW